ncbi:hypothetical protein N0V90_002025 [Kalmusia sp. IMI 367209]|nr:hypothetical protein N0V90_002025 [Kalmusia sp. IMI 367209]
MGFLSPDSRCFSFDSRGNGFGRGEGVVALVVKPLQTALKDGDVVRAVLRATASNQDGRTPILTQPSASAQESLIRYVYAKAGLDLESTRYFEAHGTGTAVGDPIEMDAIGRVFRTSRSPNDPLYVGSIKANLGHLEAASGLASLVKCVLMLERGLIVPNALFEELNPNIDAEFLNIKVPTKCIPWPNQGIRRCSINSFGFGGTNAHAVLDDAFHYLHSRGLSDYLHLTGGPREQQLGVVSSTEKVDLPQATNILDHLKSLPRPKLLIWSTADSATLERMTENYQDYYRNHIAGRPGTLDQLAYTLAARRTTMLWRTFAVVDPTDHPAAKIPGSDDGLYLPIAKRSRASTGETAVTFVFTGQGAQYVGMGMELLSYPVFEESLKLSDEILAKLGCKWSIFNVIHDNERINIPEVSQPLCTALQIALVDLLRTFGLVPRAVVGHSSGEIAAAYTVGALSHQAACKVAYYRGQVAQKIRQVSVSNPGAMMSVNLAESEVLAHLKSLRPEETVHIACVNSQTNVTLSGPSDSIDILKCHFDQLGIFAQKVNTGVAYHSPAMRAASTNYLQLIGELDMGSGGVQPITMISSVTGHIATSEMLAKAQYWVDNLLMPVRFADALQRMEGGSESFPLPLEAGSITDLVEIGPHAALRRPVMDTSKSWRYHTVLKRAHNPLRTILQALGALFCHGHPVSVVSDRTICPGTGLMVIALEAARQAVDTKSRPISSFLLKDAEFIAPVMIGQTPQDATEITIELRPIEDIYEKDSVESEVQIYSYHDDNWKLCFSANIQLEYEAVQNPQSSWVDETSWERTKIKEQLHSTATSCTQLIDQRTFYQFCEKQGLKYGPSFQLLDSIRWDGDNTSMARIDMTSTERILKDADSPVHPAILDAIVHLMFAQVSKGTARSMPMAVPRRIAKARISAKPWNQVTSAVQLSSIKDTIPGSLTSFTGNIQVVDDEGFPLCMIQTLQMTEVSRVEEAEDEGPTRTLLHQLSWKPQLSSMSPVELQQLCNLDPSLDNLAFRENFFPKIELAMRASIRQALREITQEDVDRAPAYLKKFVAYLELQYSMQMFPEDSDLHGPVLESLLTECVSEYPKWQLFPRAARALPSIIQGKTNALEVLFNENGAEDYYSEIFGFFSQDNRVRKFLDLLTHEKPGLKILEIGSGTGSMTCIILSAIEAFEKETGQTRLAEYTYTDISPSFFEAAREKFVYFEDRMVFKTFNVDIDPIQQGFQEAHYDVVVAGSVLHVTQDLAAGLTRLHRLLKLKGHLLLLEITNLHSACNTVGFGPLEGWWQASEEWRQYGPLATEQRWDELMRDVGFSGVDLSLYDGYMTNLMISTSLGTLQTNGVPNRVLNGLSNGVSNGVSNHGQTDILLLIDEDSVTHRALAAKIQRRHQHVQVINLADVDRLSERMSPSKIVVSLLECGAPRLATIKAADFYALRTHIKGIRNLLWVSGNSSATDPHFSLATGLLRCLRSEQASKHIVSLSIESCPPGAEAEFVSKLLNSCFLDESNSEELEFVVRHGHLNIGRLRENAELEAERKSRMDPQLISQSWESGPPLVLEAGVPGMTNTLQFVEDSAAPDLAPNEIEIKASVWPISSRDVSIVLGRMENAGLGLECAGTISRVGAACSNMFTPGERVLMVHPGIMRSFPRAPADAIFKLPEILSFNDAVAGMIPGMTAWYALVQVGRLQRGEKVLIHDAADGTGQMAIKIAKMLGAEMFATVDSEEKRRLVIGLDIPESHVFYSRDSSFVKGVKRITNDYGVDVVINSLYGQGLRASLECIAPYGRFVNLGKLDIMAKSSLPMASFANNVSFASVDLQHIISKNSALKILVHKSTQLFQADASYLVAGGLGGLGRAILRWMVDRGAKNLVVPSRSGVSSQAASKVVSELISQGINIITPRCDVSSSEQLSALLQTYTNMAPIRGCISLAMVLQDAVFENMTHEQWSETIRSKVDATWNLHQLLPPKMDFFILASSFLGVIGSTSQSNYAAGCTFQDALAHMRTSREEFGPSISLDLAWIEDIDVDANNADRFQSMGEHVRHMGTIQTRDVLAMLEHFCDPLKPVYGPDESQLLIGTDVPSVFDDRGEDSFPGHLMRPMFAPFLVKRQNKSTDRKRGAGSAQEDAVQRFRQVKGIPERGAAVVDALMIKLSLALGLQAENIDPRKSLSNYGVDSLMAVELRNWIWRNFKASVAVFDIMDGKPLKGVAQLVAEKAE